MIEIIFGTIAVISLLLKEYMLFAWSISTIAMKYHLTGAYGGLQGDYKTIIKDYPLDGRYIEPEKMKFLFPWYRSGGRGLPVELFITGVHTFWSLVIGSIFVIVGVIWNSLLLGLAAFFLMGYDAIILGVMIRKAEKKCFLVKYKEINRYNMKYWFLSGSGLYEGKAPSPSLIGKCEVVSIDKKKDKKSVYITVKIVETGEVFHKVIAGNSLVQEANGRIFKLYQICKVNYII